METDLLKLNPEWISSRGEGISRNGVPVPHFERAAIGFDCPCGCKERRCIPIKHPNSPDYGWNSNEKEFDSLSLTPSIQVTIACKTHFWITDGKITP